MIPIDLFDHYVTHDVARALSGACAKIVGTSARSRHEQRPLRPLDKKYVDAIVTYHLFYLSSRSLDSSIKH